MFTCGSPFQRSDHSRKACLYLQTNQDTLMPQLQRSGTLWNRPAWCIHWGWSLWSLLGCSADHYCKKQHYPLKKGLFASFMAERNQRNSPIQLQLWHFFGHSFLRDCAQKRMSWAQQLQMSSVICLVPDAWQMKQKLNFMIQFAAHKEMLYSASGLSSMERAVPRCHRTLQACGTKRRLDAGSDASPDVQRWGELRYGERSWRSPQAPLYRSVQKSQRWV